MLVPSVQVCTFWLLTRSVMDSPPAVPRARTVKLLLPPPLLLEDDQLPADDSCCCLRSR